METGVVGLVIQGGSVGVALVALAILYKVIINDHSQVKVVIETIKQAAVAHTTLAEAIKGLDETVRTKL
jgi:hypothetical protein